MRGNSRSCGGGLEARENRGRREDCDEPIAASEAAPSSGHHHPHYDEVLDCLGKQCDLLGEMIAQASIQPWLESCERYRELNAELDEVDETARVRALLEEIMRSLGPGPAERDVRAGRRALLEALLQTNDSAIEFWSDEFPRTRTVLVRCRSSPADEAFADEVLPNTCSALKSALERLDQAHAECTARWREMIAEDSWAVVARKFVGGASKGAVIGATLGWFGVAVAAAEQFLEGGTKPDAGDHWQAAYQKLLEASDEVGNQMLEWLPSMERASRHVLRTFYERAARTIAAGDPSPSQWQAWLEAEAEDLAGIEADYSEFSDDS